MEDEPYIVHRTATIPFSRGQFSVTMDFVYDTLGKRADALIDHVWAVAVDKMNNWAGATLTKALEYAGIDGDGSTEGSQIYTFEIDDKVKMQLSLGIELDGGIDPEVALGVVGSRVISDIYKEVIERIIDVRVSACEAWEEHNERTRERLMENDPFAMLGAMIGGDGDFGFLGREPRPGEPGFSL